MVEDRYSAFVPGEQVKVTGAGTGPLHGLRFAAKDLFDVKGHKTGGGNPDWLRLAEPAATSAWAIEKLLAAGADLFGKTHTDELSRGIFGENAHYGTPLNPVTPDRVPGGSSSGSAVAVAADYVDFALGTDTGGSVRAPAAFCGLFGLRPTHGRIPYDGVVVQAPTFDTVGLMAKRPGVFETAASVLLGEDQTRIDGHRIILSEDALAECDSAVASVIGRAANAAGLPTADAFRWPFAEWYKNQTALQWPQAWRTFQRWIDEVNPRFGFEVAQAFLLGASVTAEQVEAGAAFRDKARAHLDQLFQSGIIVAMPTSPDHAPLRDRPRSEIAEVKRRVIGFTSIAGMGGCPQVTIPIHRDKEIPVGLSLIGPRGSDVSLIARAIELHRQLKPTQA